MDGAGAIPIAIPLCWWTMRSLNRIRLLFMTMSSASSNAFGLRCGNFSSVASSERKDVNRSMHCCVLMFVYIETASYVKRHALAGNGSIVSNSCLSSKEFLKYVCCVFTMGWSCLSTHFPTAWGRLAQSEHTGLVEIGVLCNLASR